jgi:hypothetical protein
MSVSLVFIANGFRHANRGVAPLRLAAPDAGWRNPAGREYVRLQTIACLRYSTDLQCNGWETVAGSLTGKLAELQRRRLDGCFLEEKTLHAGHAPRYQYADSPAHSIGCPGEKTNPASLAAHGVCGIRQNDLNSDWWSG